MGFVRRWLERLNKSDELRLAEELRAWTGSLPGVVHVADAPLRNRVKLGTRPGVEIRGSTVAVQSGSPVRMIRT